MSKSDTSMPLSEAAKDMIRVDHAGEYGAVAIYKGQLAVFDRLAGKREIAKDIQHMADGEAEHLEAFDALVAKHKVRPTALAPIWNAAGFALGAATALIGEKAAHACTEAVESVIEEHYQSQIDELDATGEAPELKAKFTKFREDELEHKHTAEEGGAKEAAGYPILSRAIKMGCRAAIKISKRV